VLDHQGAYYYRGIPVLLSSLPW